MRPLSTAELEDYARGLRARDARQEARDAAYVESVQSRFETAVNCLVREFAVSSVILFGSFAQNKACEGSDVDLLITGLAVHRLIDATLAVEKHLYPAHVDLVPREIARPAILKRALAEGKILYEKP